MTLLIQHSGKEQLQESFPEAMEVRGWGVHHHTAQGNACDGRSFCIFIVLIVTCLFTFMKTHGTVYQRGHFL